MIHIMTVNNSYPQSFNSATTGLACLNACVQERLNSVRNYDACYFWEEKELLRNKKTNAKKTKIVHKKFSFNNDPMIDSQHHIKGREHLVLLCNKGGRYHCYSVENCSLPIESINSTLMFDKPILIEEDNRAGLQKIINSLVYYFSFQATGAINFIRGIGINIGDKVSDLIGDTSTANNAVNAEWTKTPSLTSHKKMKPSLGWKKRIERLMSFPLAAASSDVGNTRSAVISLKENDNSIDDERMLSDRGEDSEDELQCHIIIKVPNNHAESLHQNLSAEFSRSTTEQEWTLKWLLGYDNFLAQKVKLIFSHALYLTNKKVSLDTLLLKKICEKTIDACLMIPEAMLISYNRFALNDYQRLTLDNFFVNLENDFRHALINIDFRTLRQTFALKNGKSFLEAKEQLNHNFRQAKSHDEKKSLKVYFNYLEIMEVAHAHYVSKLAYDNIHTPMAQLLYLNDRELCMSLIEEDTTSLARDILTRFYYYIFDYNRSNSISVHGDTFLVPGEFTEYWEYFDANMPKADPEELKMIFSQQILSYITQSNDKRKHLNRSIKLLEIVKVLFSEIEDIRFWHPKNIRMYTKSIEIIELSIKNNLNFSPDYIEPSHNQWYMTMAGQIIFDKECIIFLDYLKYNQIKFNNYAEDFYSNEIVLHADNQAQRLAMAKVAAMKNITFGHIEPDVTQQILIDYDDQLQKGNLDLLIKTAAYWYLDFYPDINDYLTTLNVLDVLKAFYHYDFLNFQDFTMRAKEEYSSVFDLKRYEDLADGDKYFSQFSTYQYHDCAFEARNLTYNLVINSNLDFFDIIYPPKEIYAFKLYSRKYLLNPLYEDTWVSVPANNLGYILITKTYNNKFSIISTLLNAPFAKMYINDMSLFVQRLIYEWHETRFNLDLKSRRKINVSVSELCSILYEDFDQAHDITDFLDLIVIAPEENRYTNPMPAYSFVADNAQKKFTSLLEEMDYWNEKTLLETASTLKTTLVQYDWTSFITSQIPFYSLIWNSWYDPEYKAEFKDVFLDLFDILLALVPAGSSVARITRNGFIQVLTQAKIAKIPSHSLKSYIISHLFISSPKLMMKSSAKFSETLLGLINPVPFYNVFQHEIGRFFVVKTADKIDWIKDFVSDCITKKNERIKTWASEVNRQKLTLMDGGIFYETGSQLFRGNFVSISNNFYAAIWDPSLLRWRITDSSESFTFNYAVPVMNISQNNWSAARFIDQDPIFPLHELDLDNDNGYSILNEIKFEPLKNHVEESTSAVSQYVFKNLVYYMNFLKPKFITLSPDLSDVRTLLRTLMDNLNNLDKLHAELINSYDKNPQRQMTLFHYNIFQNKTYDLRFRTIYLWGNAFAVEPIVHNALNIIVGNDSYVVDINPPFDNRDDIEAEKWVFFENVWFSHYINNRNMNGFLIKYTDTSKLEDAALPFDSASIHPGYFLNHAYLLAEPLWYKAAVVKYFETNKHSLSKDILNDRSILDVARTMSDHRRDFFYHNEQLPIAHDFPFRLLKKLNLIDKKNHERMTNLMWWSVNTNLPIGSYMSSSMAISSYHDLLIINSGNLLAIIDDDGFLATLLISVGNGRFFGSVNPTFNEHLLSGPSIIVIEEIGNVTEGKFVTRNGLGNYNLFAGAPDGVAHPLPILKQDDTDSYGFAKNITVMQPVAESNIKRLDSLLGGRWSIVPLRNAIDRLDIIMHVSKFGKDDIRIEEFEHIIRASMYINRALPDIADLRMIEYVSCFEEFITTQTTGQFLANALQTVVHYYPYRGGNGIRTRHPNWFSVFSPQPEIILGLNTLFYENNLIAEFVHRRKKMTRLIDLVDTLLSLKKNLGHREKRHIGHQFPFIYINIAQYILMDIAYNDFIEQHGLNNQSAELLQLIKSEYGDLSNETENIYIQCYLDILYSIDEFKHLAKWINVCE